MSQSGSQCLHTATKWFRYEIKPRDFPLGRRTGFQRGFRYRDCRGDRKRRQKLKALTQTAAFSPRIVCSLLTLLSCDHWFGRATIDAIQIVEDWIEVGDLDRDFMSIGDLVRRVTDEAYKEALAIPDNERKAAEDDDDPGPDPGGLPPAEWRVL